MDGNYTSIQAEITVPNITFGANPDETASLSEWVGIVDANGLVQAGVNEFILSTGETRFNAFWATGNGDGDAFKETVLPGDDIIATVTCTDNCTPGAIQTWDMTVHDVTQDWTDTMTRHYSSVLSRAVYILEDPTRSLPDNLRPLAGYGIVTFKNALLGTNGGPLTNPNLQPPQRFFQIDLGQTSSPSIPNSTTDGFNICMGTGGNYERCPTPRASGTEIQ